MVKTGCSEWMVMVAMMCSPWVLVARILLVGLASSILASGLDPLGVAAEATLKCLLGVGIHTAWCHLGVDDVLSTQLAYFLCNG